MKLWRISQGESTSPDTYGSAVVAAETAEEARLINPDSAGWTDHGLGSAWCGSPDRVSVDLIGEAVEGVAAGVIVASFNAG